MTSPVNWPQDFVPGEGPLGFEDEADLQAVLLSESEELLGDIQTVA